MENTEDIILYAPTPKPYIKNPKGEWSLLEQTQRAAETFRKYPPGTRIIMDHMNDPYPVPDGTKGTVEFVNKSGMLLVLFDNNRETGVYPQNDLPDGDRYTIIAGEINDKIEIRIPDYDIIEGIDYSVYKNVKIVKTKKEN